MHCRSIIFTTFDFCIWHYPFNISAVVALASRKPFTARLRTAPKAQQKTPIATQQLSRHTQKFPIQTCYKIAPNLQHVLLRIKQKDQTGCSHNAADLQQLHPRLSKQNWNSYVATATEASEQIVATWNNHQLKLKQLRKSIAYIHQIHHNRIQHTTTMSIIANTDPKTSKGQYIKTSGSRY